MKCYIWCIVVFDGLTDLFVNNKSTEKMKEQISSEWVQIVIPDEHKISAAFLWNFAPATLDDWQQPVFKNMKLHF